MGRPKKEAVETVETPVKSTPRPQVYLIANQHTADIMLPRSTDTGVLLPPVILTAGAVTPVPCEEWEKRRNIRAVQNYLDRGLLAEVKKSGPVPVLSETSSELVIPPHLGGNEQLGEIAPQGARVTKTNISSIEI